LERTRIANLVEFALAAAAREDLGNRQLGEIHLLKMVYLADLAYAETHDGKTFTGVPWVFHNFGPWDVALHALLATLLASSPYRSEHKASILGEYTRYAIAEDDPEEIETRFRDLERALPAEAASTVKWAVRQFGADTQDLLHHVYRTEPMLRAAPEDLLDFSRLGLEPPSSCPAIPQVQAEPPSRTQVRKAEDAKAQAKGRIKALLNQKREARRGHALRVDADPDYLEIMGLLEQDDAIAHQQVAGVMDIHPDYWETGTRRLFGLP